MKYKKLKDHAIDSWLTKRERTRLVMQVQSILNGTEASMTYTYLYLYLTNVLHTASNTVLFYTSIVTVYSLFTIIASLVLGRIFDKYRNLRQMMILCNILLFIGNLLYCIPLSPWLLLISRLFAAIGASSRSMICGELVRCYIGDDVLQQLSKMGMFYGLGYVIGPGLNFFFLDADFYFVGIHITYINGAVFLLMISSIIQLIITVIFVSNLSKEYDIRAEETATKSDEPQDDDKYGLWNVLGKLVSNYEAILVFISSMLLVHVFSLYDIWQPMAFVKYMKWGKFAINLTTFGYGICSITAFIIFTRLSLSQKQIVYFTQGCIFLNICMFSIFLAWRFFNKNIALDISLAVVFCVFFDP